VKRRHVFAFPRAKTVELGQLSSYERSELETCAIWFVIKSVQIL
jgi:hypothetical protein